MRLKNKFYIGSREILTNNWGHPTLSMTVEAARQRLARDSGLHHVVISKVVCVVRRQTPAPPAVVVDKVR